MTYENNIFGDVYVAGQGKSQHDEFLDELHSLLEKHNAAVVFDYDAVNEHTEISLRLDGQDVSLNYTYNNHVEVDKYNVKERLR